MMTLRDKTHHNQSDNSPNQPALLLKQARLLIARLERLTPDSAWARRASGCRGTLIRLIGELETSPKPIQSPISGLNPKHPANKDLQRVLDQGFAILHAAARESLTKRPQ